MKKNLGLLLKFTLAIGLIFWLVNSGKLDLNLIVRFMQNPMRFALGFGGLILITLIVTWRYGFIIQSKIEKTVPFKDMLKYNWIGIFFNSVMPGSVSGDIVKVYYLRGYDENLSTRFLFASILIDRFAGLFGIIFLLGFFSIFNYGPMTALSPDVKYMLHLNFLLLAGVVFGFFLLFFGDKLPRKILAPMFKIDSLKNIAHKLIDAWENFCLFRGVMIKLTAISIVIQSLVVFFFWFMINPFADAPIPLMQAYSLVPIGFIGIAVPLAPSGLGVGHALFHELFQFIGVSNGASLFNIFFLVQLLVNLVGVVPYITLSERDKKALTQPSM